MPDVDAVGGGVLADDEQLLDASLHEPLGLGHHVARGTAGEAPAQVRDDAERAAVVAALGDLQIRVVARREAQALGRHQVDEGIVQRRDRLVHGSHHRLVLVGTGDGEHAGVLGEDAVLLDPEAAGDDDAAVLGDGLADGAEALLARRVQEAAGVDHHDVGAGIVAGELVAFGAQLGDDAFRVDQRLGTAERYEADAGRGLRLGRGAAGRRFRGGSARRLGSG